MTTDKTYTLEQLMGGNLTIDYRLPKAPLYVSVYNVLAKLIQNKELKAGDKIPSEYDLCEYLGVARSTVRMALLVLQEDGLVIIRRGKGTFVEHPKSKGQSPADNLFAKSAILAAGKRYGTADERFELVPGEEYLCTKLGTEEGRMVGMFRMVHLADGVPAVLTQDFFLPDTGFENSSLDFSKAREWFENWVQSEYDKVDSSFIPTLSQGERSALLKTGSGDQLLLVSTDVWAKGKIIVFSKHYYNTGIVKYAVTAQK